MSACRPPGPAVVVPFKGFEATKSRLASVLGPGERRALAAAMLSCVVEACHGAGLRVWISGGGAAVRRWAHEHGAGWLEEAPGGLNGTLEAALGALEQQWASALILPSDLPWLASEEVRELATAGWWGDVVLVASPDGGTNALRVPLPAPFCPVFGPGSFAIHRGLAVRAGRVVRLLDLPGVRVDLDRPEQLRCLEPLPFER